MGSSRSAPAENLRANLSAALSPKFDLSVNTGFSKTDQRAPNVDNNVTGIGGLIYLTSGTKSLQLRLHVRRHARRAAVRLRSILAGADLPAGDQEGNPSPHGSADAQWRPFNWMQNSGTVGVDFAASSYFNLCRFQECSDFGTSRLGFVTNNHLQNRNFTTKLVSNSSWTAEGVVEPEDVVGCRLHQHRIGEQSGERKTLPPGAQTVGADGDAERERQPADRGENARGVRAGAGEHPRPNVPHGGGALGPEQRVRHKLPARPLSEGESSRGSSRTSRSSRSAIGSTRSGFVRPTVNQACSPVQPTRCARSRRRR